MDCSQRVNRNRIACDSSPYSDQQFQHIGALRAGFQPQGLPAIRADRKKCKLFGEFKSAGAKRDRSSVHVNDHVFRSAASGVGICYGA